MNKIYFFDEMMEKDLESQKKMLKEYSEGVNKEELANTLLQYLDLVYPDTKDKYYQNAIKLTRHFLQSGEYDKETREAFYKKMILNPESTDKMLYLITKNHKNLCRRFLILLQIILQVNLLNKKVQVFCSQIKGSC
jgi:hypothetical protein